MSKEIPGVTLKKGVAGVYLGGGRLSSGENKAEIVFGGLPVSVRVLTALLRTPEITRIVAIVPSHRDVIRLLEHQNKQIDFIEARESFSENAKIALEETDIDEDVLVLFSDLPFVLPNSLSRVVNTRMSNQLIIPSIFERDVSQISRFHNLHFNPSKEGYFHFGSAAFIRKEARELIDLERLGQYYAGRSFRIDFREKLRTIFNLAGKEAIVIALRIWISANLQHKGLHKLDRLMPSPTIREYTDLVTNIIGVRVGILLGPFGDLFLDFDYTSDMELLKRNFEHIQEFMLRHAGAE